MAPSTSHHRCRWPHVLVSHEHTGPPSPWLADFDRRLAAERIALDRSCSLGETLAFVESGGVDAAVLWSSATDRCGLVALEMIRGLSVSLPCLLVTPDVGPRTLGRALALRASSVIHQPVDAVSLTELLVNVMRKRLG